jgi:hypothetical protein
VASHIEMQLLGVANKKLGSLISPIRLKSRAIITTYFTCAMLVDVFAQDESKKPTFAGFFLYL